MYQNQATKCLTGEVRLSYANLLEPRAPLNGGEPKYSVTLLIPKSDTATKADIDAAIQAAMRDGKDKKWGGVMPPQPKIPLHDGDGVRQSGEPYGPECKGHWVITASSKQRPGVVDANIQPIIDPTEIYSGMYGRVTINFFAYASNGNKGVGCGLGNVQKLRDGEPLGGHASAESDFGAAPAAVPEMGTAPMSAAINPITGLPM
ncbi:Protein of uncharacterised function (DUF2815) [Anaerotruncus sp. 2789STDY5834896]|uniref:Protein of uncharacterized function (DUF2815) n=1 Tax=uncultured Anaerotruncus sp. TaxID=905011 RepID=A0A1C6G0M6_9FIRM|nr:Protein of uncharacterised function (DUF2815) [uncultured Anaerotruncus sp.]